MQAYEQLLDWLRDGTFPPGMMLSEHDLAHRLSVSRTPVRAALRRLESDGWLTIYPQRGALVRTLTAAEAIDVSDARQVLESACIDALSDEARVRLCRELEQSIQQQIFASEQGNYEQVVKLTIDFHRAFVVAGDNPILLDFYDRLRDRQEVMTLRARPDVAGRWSDFIAEHRSLVECARAGDRAAFLVELRAHIVNTHGSLMGSL
ncbi:GntR family transcriptional regulator [Plantibacter sp. M259]|uniref:GntR family transcriptional regulator n=1 Tax=Plantibacter sp. M259 TaxID=2583822 RepID=UPI00143D4DD3|nr:GntR family transcriptional regulator [Plantibacter sp. M259]